MGGGIYDDFTTSRGSPDIFHFGDGGKESRGANAQEDLFIHKENDHYLVALSSVHVMPPLPHGTLLGELVLGSLDSKPGTVLMGYRLNILGSTSGRHLPPPSAQAHPSLGGGSGSRVWPHSGAWPFSTPPLQTWPPQTRIFPSTPKLILPAWARSLFLRAILLRSAPCLCVSFMVKLSKSNFIPQGTGSLILFP